MLRLATCLVLLYASTRTAYVTNSPSFADRLDRLYEKLEKLTIPPLDPLEELKERTPQEKLYDKLEKLNSLAPDKVLTDDDEELLAAMQMWGMLSAEQLDGVLKDLQSVRDEDYGKGDRLTDEDSDADWNDVDLPEGDYPMDWDPDEDAETTARPLAVTPSALNRLDYRETVETVVSAVDPIAVTNERPKILDDSSLTPQDRVALRRSVFANIAAVLKTGKCSEPPPRWLNVRQLAPAANIVYMPPCVRLHRCTADAGCCYDEAEMCAPIAGHYVAIPFYLQKADGTRNVARIRFFNHTQCACVSRETLQTTVRTRLDTTKRGGREQERYTREQDGQNDWRAVTQEPLPEKDDERTAPPQLRRCTCPTLFLAHPLEDGICSCICEWSDPHRRRECLSLARGREHFGMRDRVCVAHGDCNPPACDYGAYDSSNGRCPQRRFHRRYHHRASRLVHAEH